MANVSDPHSSSLSGSDPQNLLEYITRQKIYDSRFWKEECFGLTVADVLEKAAQQLQCIGGLPTKFLALTLKLLQLHPETELVVESFIEQDDFKYVRALGCLYVRLTAPRPVEVYQTLEPLYADRRKLRVWSAVTQEWSLLHMDEFVHQLLSAQAGNNNSRALGLALPRLPTRRVLQEAGYLSDDDDDDDDNILRPTALRDVLADHNHDPEQYLRYKAQVEQSPAAVVAWNKRCARLGISDSTTKKKSSREEPAATAASGEQVNEKDDKRRPKKKQRNYGGLFKKKDGESTTSQDASSEPREEAEHSAEYWNRERARLGLKPLRDSK